MKDKIKDISIISVRIIRWGIGIFIIFLLLMLVIIEDRQLSVMENQQNISLIKDDRSCKLLASQQLQQAEYQVQEKEQEVTDEIRDNFYNDIYLACMEWNGRDSSLSQVVQGTENITEKK